jgi:hypothetical protein
MNLIITKPILDFFFPGFPSDGIACADFFDEAWVFAECFIYILGEE